MANQLEVYLKPAQSSPIDRLPADILCKIFPLVIKLELEHLRKYSVYTFGRIKSKDTQILLSHVCKKWRFVVLNYALFWTRIETARYPMEKINTFLSRSRESPLHIIMDFGNMHGHTTPNIVETIQRHTQRIREWHVFADYSEAIIQSQFCMLNTPNLENLTLDLHCDYTLPRDRYVITPSQVFPEKLPSLRILTLVSHGTKVLKNSWLTCLTSLTIRDTGSDITLPRLVQILGLCRQLESLKLSNMRFLARFNTTMTATVSLPRLQQLQMSVREDDCNRILACLKLPDNVSWKINCETFPGSDFNLQNLPVAHGSESLQISLGDKEIDIIAHPWANFKCFAPDRGDVRHNVFAEPNCRRISRAIPSIFPDVPTLRFSFQDPRKKFVAVQDWITMVRNMESLRSLEFKIDFLGDKPYDVEMDIMVMLSSLFNDIETGSHSQIRSLKFIRFPFDARANNFIDALYNTLNNCRSLPEDFELHIQDGRDLANFTIEELRLVVKVSVSTVLEEQEWHNLPPNQLFSRIPGRMIQYLY